MKWRILPFGLPAAAFLMPAFLLTQVEARPAAAQPVVLRGSTLSVESKEDGSYALLSTAVYGPVLRSEIDAETAKGVLQSSAYPKHLSTIAPFQDALGTGQELTVTHTGLANTADLVCEFRVYANPPWGDVRVLVRNTTLEPMEIHSIYVIKSVDGSGVPTTGYYPTALAKTRRS